MDSQAADDLQTVITGQRLIDEQDVVGTATILGNPLLTIGGNINRIPLPCKPLLQQPCEARVVFDIKDTN